MEKYKIEETERFLSNNVLVKMEAELDKSILYEIYSKWCNYNNIWILSKANFSQVMYNKYKEYTPKSSRSKINRKYAWRNISLIN